MNFCIGFAFMYIVDMIVPSSIPTSIEQTAAHEASSKLPKSISKTLTPTGITTKKIIRNRSNYNIIRGQNILKFLKNIL